MASKGERLTAKQRRFVEEYAADPNAVQAYYRAFGRLTSKGKRRTYWGASKAAARLLQKDSIQTELGAANDAYAARVRVSKLRVLRELAALAFSDPGDLWDEGKSGEPIPRRWNNVPPATRRAVQSVKVKRRRQLIGEAEWEVEEVEYKLAPKGPELDKLCKKLGFYAEDKAPTDGKDDGRLAAELLGRIVAEIAARRPQPDGAGSPRHDVPGGPPVEPEPGAAGGSVPQ